MSSNPQPNKGTGRRRVLLKISGELLGGEGAFGISAERIEELVAGVCAARDLDMEIGLVIGGGNIFRGLTASDYGLDRVVADQMGMLATVMNALAVQSVFERQGAVTRVLSALPITSVCEPYIRRRAMRHLERGRIVIFAAGTGNPFFTTDSAAVLRAVEMGCSELLKGTKVDGIYDSDPRTNKNATRYEAVSYTEVLTKNLQVMDSSAIALARENSLPITVFNLTRPNAIVEALGGIGPRTVVHAG